MDEHERRLRRNARLCRFDPLWTLSCERCQRYGPANIDGVCAGCLFREKIGSLTLVAVPAALAEVRRDYGLRGESDRRSDYTKDRRAAERAEHEAGLPRLSPSEFAQRQQGAVRDLYGRPQ